MRRGVPRRTFTARTERGEAYFTLTHVVKLVGEFILAYGGIISIAVKNDHGTWGLLSLFRFRLLLRHRSLFPPSRCRRQLVRFLFFPTTHPPLAPGSHSIRRSRSVVTALRLYKFYIIFMRHKVVEKPAEEGRERELERSESGARRRGKASPSESHPSRTPFAPASCRFSHVAGRSGSHPLVFACPRGMQREGNADRARGDDASCQGWNVVRRTNSILRNVSCLVLLKISDTSFSSARRNAVSAECSRFF